MLSITRQNHLIVFCFIALLGFAPKLCAANFQLEIEGLEKKLKENVRLHMENWESIPEGDSSYIHQRLNTEVAKSLQPLGYYEPTLQHRIDGDRLILSIDPGPPVVWGNLNIDVPIDSQLTPSELNNLLKNPPFQKGEVINHASYDDYKQRLLSLTQKNGFLEAKWIKSRLLIDLRDHQAEVQLKMDPGPRYRINAIKTHGTTLDSKTINTLINVESGQWFDADAIGELYENLLGSGYFDYADIQTERLPEQDMVNLNIHLTESPKDHFSTGIGYGTDTGPRAKLGWSRPKINKRGDSLHTNLQVSSISKELITEYRIPWPHPLKRYLSWDTGYKEETTTDRESSLFSTGISLNRVEPKLWQYNYGINLENETYRQGDNPEETTTYLLPNYHYLNRQPIGFDANKTGIAKYWLDTSLGVSFLEDETRFLSVNIGASFTINVVGNHSMVTRFELGGIATGDIQEVPLSKRFYTGGDQTVRGFKYNSLAPEDKDGELIGGQFLNVFSLEYRYQVAANWKVATFADTGRTFISSHEDFHTGAGVGLRWQLPVGVLAFDVARPVSDDDGDSWRIHIYMSSLQ